VICFVSLPQVEELKGDIKAFTGLNHLNSRGDNREEIPPENRT